MRFKVYRSGFIRREWRWRLLAKNNRTVADSGEGYRNKTDCEAAIALIQAEAPYAAVDTVERA